MSDQSFLNPGTSLHIQGDENQLQEEVEFQKEEEEKEKELRELLTNAFDDFGEDDILSDEGDLSSSRLGQKSANTPHHESTPLQPPVPYMAASITNLGHGNHGNQATTTAQRSSDHFPDQSYPPFLEDSPQNDAHHWEPQSNLPPLQDQYNHAFSNTAVSNDNGHWEQGEAAHHYGNREEAEGGNEVAGHDQFIQDQYIPRAYYLENYDPLQQQHEHQEQHQMYSSQSHNIQSTPVQNGTYGEHLSTETPQYAQGAEPYRIPNEPEFRTSFDGHDQQILMPNPYNTTNQVHSQQNFHPYYNSGSTQTSENVHAYTHPTLLDSRNTATLGVHQSQENVSNFPQHQQYGSQTNFHHQQTEPPGEDNYSRATTLAAKSSIPNFEDGYRVKYTHEVEKQPSNGSGPFDQHIPGNGEVDHDSLSETRQLSQLQVLYKARGRKLEELTTELDTFKNETSREIRILKHQLSMAQGDREGMENSLKQCQALLQSAKGEINQFKNKLETTEAQLKAAKESKEELIGQLTSAESNIENLNEQVAQLTQCDSLERARVHHQSVISGLQQKYDKEVLSLKQKVDVLQEKLTEKEGEFSSLKRMLAEVQHQAELAQISRADTINRLNKTLEESQRQCHSLLQSSVAEELGVVKSQLRQATAARTMSDEMCKALQDELVDLREQLSMFESASNLGAFSVVNSTSKPREAQDDSMLDLGIKKTLDFRTPDTFVRSTSPEMSEDYVSKLRMELERCLMNNKTKRQAVTKLQSELREAKTEIHDFASRCERAEKTVEELQVKLKTYEEEYLPKEGETIAPVEKRLRKDLENLTAEKTMLVAEIQELKHRLEEVATNEEQVNEINRELSAEISQMVRDYDQDKVDGMQKCHEAYMQMVEDAKTRVREEMTAEFTKEKSEIIQKYESELVLIKEELRGAWAEVDNAKELYIKLSEEKTKLETTLRMELEEEFEAGADKIKAQLLEEKQTELAEMKQSWETKQEAFLETAKSDWLKEQEGEINTRIETELCKARDDSLKENTEPNSKECSIDSATQTEEDMMAEAKLEKEQEIASRVAKAKEDWVIEIKETNDLELQSRFEEEKIKMAEEFKRQSKEAEPSESSEKVEEAKNELSKTEESLKMEIEKLKDELSGFENDCKNLHKEKDDLKKSLTDKISELENELKNTLCEKDKISESLRLEIAELKQEKCDLETESESAKAELETKVKEVIKETEDKFRSEMEKLLSNEQNQKELLEKALNDRVKKEVTEAVKRSRLAWLNEEEVNRATAVFVAQEAVRKDAETKYQGEITVLKEESKRLQSDLSKLKSDLVSHKEEFQQQRERIIQEKDQERKDCLQKIQTQCEEDIQCFVKDQEMTLANALKNARDQQALEKQRFEAELKQLKIREQQLLGSLRSTPNTSDNSESGRVPMEGEVTQTSSNCDNCGELESELRSFRELENLDQLKEEKDKLKEKITKYNSQVRKLIQDRQKLQMSFDNLQQRRHLEDQKEKLKLQSSGSDDSNLSSQSESRQQEEILESELKRTKALLQERESKWKNQYKELRSSLETEHSVAMETMKKKMVELRQSQAEELTKLRQEFVSEKNELSAAIKKLKESERQLTSTPVQTEARGSEKAAVLEVRAHYLEAVNKIREDVLKHVTETNLRAAEKIKEEIYRDRKSLVLEIKKTFSKVIRNILERSGLGANMSSVIKSIERHLDSITSQLMKGKSSKDTPKAVEPTETPNGSSRVSDWSENLDENQQFHSLPTQNVTAWTPSVSDDTNFNSLPVNGPERTVAKARLKHLGSRDLISDSGLGTLERGGEVERKHQNSPKHTRPKTWAGVPLKTADNDTSTDVKTFPKLKPPPEAFPRLQRKQPSLESLKSYADHSENHPILYKGRRDCYSPKALSVKSGDKGCTSEKEHQPSTGQVSENCLAASVLTQYEIENTTRHSVGSIDSYLPLEIDTESTLNSMGLGNRSPRKYNPSPEKPDSDQRKKKVPLDTQRGDNSWHHPGYKLQTPIGINPTFNPPRTSTERRLPCTKRFEENPELENSYQGRESAISDISYNLHLTNSVNSSMQDGFNHLGQSFIPSNDPPRVSNIHYELGVRNDVQRPVPIQGKQFRHPSSKFQNEKR